MANNPGYRQTLLGFRREWVIWEYERGLLYQDGRFVRVLQPGRYTFWRWERSDIRRVSVRQMSEVLTGQEVLTADRVEVRVSMVAQYAVVDPALAINTVESYSDQLYQELQLTLRDLVSGYEVDKLLEARAELGEALLARSAPRALVYGVELRRVGIRDIVLPGSIRGVFLKEIEADRQGRADLIRARHEVAAARARANTARILAENPNVARMQELEALVNLAGRPGNVVLLPNLADLLTPRPAAAALPPTQSSDGGSEDGA